MRTRRLLVVDAHRRVRSALLARLARVPGIMVVGDTAEEDEAVRLAVNLQPDIILLEPKQLDATHLVRHLREVAPASRVVVQTSYPDLWEEETLLQAGASTYLLKTLDLNSLWPWFGEAPPLDAGWYSNDVLPF
ncbi:MAG: response regulator transcription factor [Ardenticatenaceae bacterium]|nr:response regulator transcription factor [Ardenticatenaceae bacterium]HBY96827.1 hypothetical protein [Chloroflexota bacterium]